MFFYIRNMFSCLIEAVSSLSSVARFFMELEKETIKMFADITTIQIIAFYNVMTRIIVGITRNDHICLK